MVIWFIVHQWKEMTRSPFWQKNIAINIVLALVLLLLLSYLLLLGLFIDVILNKLYPGKDPVALFNGIILYYLLIELFLRKILQSLPTLNIETYLHLPIKKSTIVHYVASKSIFAIGNYLTWLVIIPFAIKVIAPSYSVTIAIVWLITVALLIFNNNFLATYMIRQITGKAYITGAMILIILSLLLLDRFEFISLTTFSTFIFGQLLVQPAYILIAIALPVISYLLNYYYLKSKLYPEEVSILKKEERESFAGNRYLKSFGLIGHLISLDLRLIWRHKRTKSVIYMAPLFLGYGLFFYPQEIYREMSPIIIFIGIFMTGGMMVNYANYCFSYESNYFDNILTHYKDFKQYILAKYVLAISVSTVCYVLTVPYLFFGAHILLINTATFLYNIGFLSFLLLYLATYSTKNMDLSRGAAFNYQGLGASHWLSMIPAFLLPVLMYLPFSWLGYGNTGLIFVGVLGLLGLAMHKLLIGMITHQFIKKKYDMAEGFRE